MLIGFLPGWLGVPAAAVASSERQSSFPIQPSMLPKEALSLPQAYWERPIVFWHQPPR